jgi:phosphoheptose isomerase
MAMAHRLFQDVSDSLALVSRDAFTRVVDLLLEAAHSGRRIYAMGNGGSASTASHLVCDLANRDHAESPAPVRAHAFTDNSAVLTAMANDLAFDLVFERQVLTLVERGDVVIAISTSGSSPNIIAGLRAARERGAVTVGLLGLANSRATEMVDVALHVRGQDPGVIETAHLAIVHALVVAIRSAARAGSSRVEATLTGHEHERVMPS